MVKRKYKPTLSRQAERMLSEHIEFLIRVSPPAARRLFADFKKVITKIADNPHRFQFADGLDAPGITPGEYRKCLFHKRYKALFYIEGEGICIDAVIDCRQKNDNIFGRTDQ